MKGVLRGVTSIRKAAAAALGCTLAWDYFRSNGSNLQVFAVWALAIHFIYFQLPLKSRALPYFHALSFVGAYVIPALYGYLLINKPRIEVDHAELWELSPSTVLVRAVIVHFSPLLFHTLDMSAIQAHLISAYQTKPRKFIYMWSFLSFGILGEHLLSSPLISSPRSLYTQRVRLTSPFVVHFIHAVISLGDQESFSSLPFPRLRILKTWWAFQRPISYEITSSFPSPPQHLHVCCFSSLYLGGLIHRPRAQSTP
jgi:hypothetical protein